MESGNESEAGTGLGLGLSNAFMKSFVLPNGLTKFLLQVLLQVKFLVLLRRCLNLGNL